MNTLNELHNVAPIDLLNNLRAQLEQINNPVAQACLEGIASDQSSLLHVLTAAYLINGGVMIKEMEIETPIQIPTPIQLQTIPTPIQIEIPTPTPIQLQTPIQTIQTSIQTSIQLQTPIETPIQLQTIQIPTPIEIPIQLQTPIQIQTSIQLQTPIETPIETPIQPPRTPSPFDFDSLEEELKNFTSSPPPSQQTPDDPTASLGHSLEVSPPTPFPLLG
jgi:hypothetical protein